MPSGASATFPTQIGFGDNRPFAVDKSGQRFLLKVAPDPRLIAIMDWRTLLKASFSRIGATIRARQGHLGGVAGNLLNAFYTTVGARERLSEPFRELAV
jgi:hypothetical protein